MQRPKVAWSFAALVFTCISHASVGVLASSDDEFHCDDGTILDPSLINDFFCDCGSDEPLTSACSHVASSKFLCRADGSQNEGRFIPSSRVNDNICDCCDGSDEFHNSTSRYAEKHQSAVACPNTCSTLSEEDVRLIRKLSQRRRQLVVAAQQSLAKQREEIVALKEQQPEFKSKIETLKKELVDLEAEERKQQRTYLSTQTSKMMTKLGLDKVSGQEAFELVFDFFNQQTAESSSLNRKFFHHIFKNQPRDSIAKTYSAAHFHQDITGLKSFTSTEAESARLDLQSTQDKEKEILHQIKAASSSTNYGADDAFYHLSSKCLSERIGAFEYEVCPFGNASQTEHAKVGVKKTTFSLGHFSQWDPDRANTMLFGEGQVCPGHGPRRTDVHFICGEDDAIVSVEEPNVCHYVFEVTTVSACFATESQLDILRLNGVDVEELHSQVDEACSLDDTGNPLF